MAQAVKQESLGGGLGALLDRLDTLIGKIGFGLERPVEILELMDEITAQFGERRAQGAGLQAEEEQFTTSQAGLKAAAGAFLKEMGGTGALKAARAERQPSQEAWWWYMDRVQAAQLGASLGRTTKIAAVAVIVLVVLGILYQLFLRPDPKVVAVYGAGQNATSLVLQGKFDAALAEIDQGLAVVPGSPELLTRRGVVLEMMGKSDLAATQFDQARQSFPSDGNFLLTRAQLYLEVNNLDAAILDGQAAATADPQNAQAYTVIGTAQELNGQTQAAYASYQKGLGLADAQGNQSLVAQIKVKMAYLMQSLSGPAGLVTPTP